MAIIKNKINKGLGNVLSEEQLRSEVAKLAKRANTRLRAIEKANLENASESYRKLKGDEYMGASYIKQTKHGQLKFDTALKEKTLPSLREEYQELSDFLNSFGSSIKGIKERWQIPYSIHQKYRKEHDLAPMSYERFSRYFSDFAYEILKSMFGSDQAIVMMDDLLEASDDDWSVVEEAVTKMEQSSSKTGEISFRTAQRISKGVINEYRNKVSADAQYNTYSTENIDNDTLDLLNNI